MTIYKVSFYSHQASSEGFSFHLKRGDAVKARNAFKDREGENFDKEGSKIEKLDVVFSSEAVVSALNIHGSHPDNG